MSYWIVELKAGVWLAPWHYPNGRTLVLQCAQQYASKGAATRRLNAYRKTGAAAGRMYNAKVVEVRPLRDGLVRIISLYDGKGDDPEEPPPEEG